MLSPARSSQHIGVTHLSVQSISISEFNVQSWQSWGEEFNRKLGRVYQLENTWYLLWDAGQSSIWSISAQAAGLRQG